MLLYSRQMTVCPRPVLCYVIYFSVYYIRAYMIDYCPAVTRVTYYYKTLWVYIIKLKYTHSTRTYYVHTQYQKCYQVYYLAHQNSTGCLIIVQIQSQKCQLSTTERLCVANNAVVVAFRHLLPSSTGPSWKY